jgi:hypothetical protein
MLHSYPHMFSGKEEQTIYVLQSKSYTKFFDNQHCLRKVFGLTLHGAPAGHSFEDIESCVGCDASPELVRCGFCLNQVLADEDGDRVGVSHITKGPFSNGVVFGKSGYTMLRRMIVRSRVFIFFAKRY